MKRRILIHFANADYSVSPETAERVKKAIPANRYSTTTVLESEPTPDLPTRLGGRTTSSTQSVFDRARKDTLTPKQEQLAKRLSKHLTPPPKRK